MKIVVTRHAVERLKQRFSRIFWRYMDNDKMVKNLIIGQIEGGRHLTDWKMCPFYVNKMSSMHGSGLEIFLNSGVYFLCNVQDGVCVVKTCLPNVIFYKKKLDTKERYMKKNARLRLQAETMSEASRSLVASVSSPGSHMLPEGSMVMGTH